MVAVLDFTEVAVFKALRGFLLQIVPIPGTEVIRAQVNRVPEPAVSNYILMTQVTRTRFATNTDITQDTLFIGSVSGTLLAVTTLIHGQVQIGATLVGAGVAANAVITGYLNGTGGTGTYQITPRQTATPSQTFYAGTKRVLQPSQFNIQLDVHGPACIDSVEVISTLFRDEYATNYFDNCGIAVQALYTSDPRQVPFINGENQWEDRWLLEVAMQVNQVVTVPQQFAQTLNAGLIDVEVVYPAI